MKTGDAASRALFRVTPPAEALESWDRLIKRWLTSPSVRSERSRRQHTSNLRRIRPMLSSTPALVELEELERIGAWCLDKSNGLKSGTRHNVGATARKLLHYAALHQYIPWSVAQIDRSVTLPRLDDRPAIQVFDPSHIAALFEAAEDPREVALLETMVSAGLRVGEVTRLRINHINRKLPRLSIRESISRERRIRIPKSAYRHLVDYLESTNRTLKSHGPVFLPTGNRRSDSGNLSSRSVERILSRIGQRAGVHAHPSALRHTFAVNFLLTYGTEMVDELKQVLGLNSTASIERYVNYVEPKVSPPKRATKKVSPSSQRIQPATGAQSGQRIQPATSPGTQSAWEDPTNFDLLFDRYYRPISHFFAARGFSTEECRDLTQETFLGAYKGLGHFRHDSSLETWLFTLASNIWRNALRSRSVKKRDGLEVSIHTMVEESLPASPMADAPDDPRDNALADERVRMVREAIDGLPAQMRRCLLLRIDHEMKYTEIASVLQVSIETVKSQLFQAKMRLKEKLDNYGIYP